MPDTGSKVTSVTASKQCYPLTLEVTRRTIAMCHIKWHIETMPSVNIRQLRDTRRLKELLSAGQTVELRERQHVIARIVPAPQPSVPEHWPDFSRRRQKIFGKRVLSGAGLVIDDRGRF